jgi:hypothetical protein
VVDLAACGAGYRFVGMVILRYIFGGKALDAGASFRAAIDKQRHNKSSSICRLVTLISIKCCYNAAAVGNIAPEPLMCVHDHDRNPL